jgi:hypothetical protein
VYNFEAADNAGMDGDHLPTLKSDAVLQAIWHPELLEGVMVLKAEAADGSPLTAVPNYARNNRQGYSAVWIRDQSQAPATTP